MAQDTVNQIHHPSPIRPASPHPQNVRANRGKKDKKKRDKKRDKPKDRVTINSSSNNDEKKTEISTPNSASLKRSRIDIRI